MLRVLLLGDIEFFSDTRRLNDFASRKAKLIFAFLLLNQGRLFERPQLSGQFWTDLSEARARKALNTEIWRISSSLKREKIAPQSILISRTDAIGIRRQAQCWTDVHEFESALKPLSGTSPENCPEAVFHSISDAVKLYRGRLLDGVFDDWCLIRREVLTAEMQGALEFLMRYHMHRKEWQAALAYGQQLLSQDPLMEHVHRALMRCHYLIGNRPAAIKQYAVCQQILRVELDVNPMEETERVYQAMVMPKPSPAPSLHRRRKSGNSTLQNVDLALANIHTAVSWLEEASQQLKNKSKSG